MPRSPRSAMLAEWRAIAAHTAPGARTAATGDLPVRKAHVRTSALEKHLADAMAAWLTNPRAAPPWDEIKRALASTNGEAGPLAAHAIVAVCTLRTACWKTAIKLFPTASTPARQAWLSQPMPAARYHSFLILAASDADPALRADALGRACLLANTRLFAKVHAAAQPRAKTARDHAALARSSALAEHGFFAARTRNAWRFEVHCKAGRNLIGTAIEDVNAHIVTALGPQTIANHIRRVTENPRLAYPIDWEAQCARSAKTKITPSLSPKRHNPTPRGAGSSNGQSRT